MQIPTAESLKLTSHATEPATSSLPPNKHTESKSKRDDWMLDPVSRPTVGTDSIPSSRVNAESLTDGYGEEASSSRTLGGDIDFFSSIGTEHKRGKPSEPQKVSWVLLIAI